MPFDAGALLSRLGIDTSGFTSGLGKAKAAAASFGTNLNASQRQLQGMQSQSLSLGKTMFAGLGFYAATKAVLGFTKSISESINAAADFEESMANVSTLLDTSVIDVEELSASVLNMTDGVLKSSKDLSSGLYQVFSAGVTESSEALDVLRVSAIAATAGISDTFTSVDAITTILNAYGLQTSQATDVSDLLFQTVKLGKTTFSELAGAIGTVISPAASVGIELEEIFATLATLTKGGIDTRLATTALRATLLSVLKPTEEARKKAQELGIEWNTQSLRAKGLIAFLGELREKTQGNSEDLAAIVPNVRALNAVLASVGAQYNELIKIEKQFSDRAGSTAEAFAKQADTYRSKIKAYDIAAENLRITLGNLALSPISKVINEVTQSLKDMREIVKDLNKYGFFGRLDELVRAERTIEEAKRDQQKMLDNLSQAERNTLKELKEFGGDIVTRIKVDLGLTIDEFLKMPQKMQNSLLRSLGIVDIQIKETQKKLRGISGVAQITPEVTEQPEIIPAFDEKTTSFIDSLIDKNKELGKTELEIFNQNTQAYIDSIGDRLIRGDELSEKQIESIQAIHNLRQGLIDEEKLQTFQFENERTANLEMEEEKRKNIRRSFLKEFENDEKIQLQLINQREQQTLEKARQLGVETTDITRFYAEERKKFELQVLEERFNNVQQFGTATANLAGNLNELLVQQGKEKSEELFIIQKAANIATAIANTAVAATEALKIPPPPVGIALAGIITAAGLAQVAIIAQQKLAEGGLVNEPISALIGEAGPEAVTPVEKGVSPIMEESVRTVMDEDKQKQQTINIINIDDPNRIRAIIADQQARTSERVILNILGRRNSRAILGENTLPGVL